MWYPTHRWWQTIKRACLCASREMQVLAPLLQLQRRQVRLEAVRPVARQPGLHAQQQRRRRIPDRTGSDISAHTETRTCSAAAHYAPEVQDGHAAAALHVIVSTLRELASIHVCEGDHCGTRCCAQRPVQPLALLARVPDREPVALQMEQPSVQVERILASNRGAPMAAAQAPPQAGARECPR